MTTIQPKGEDLRKAVKWISSERLEDEERSIHLLIGEAALRLHLSPKDEDYLRFYYD